MKKYLLRDDRPFFKANLHCHSTLSDGRNTPEELKKIYQSLGYSILAYTDHDIFLPHEDLAEENFLPLHGFEMEITEEGEKAWHQKQTCHICLIALEKDMRLQPMWHRSEYLFGNAPQYRDQVQFDENQPDYIRHYDGEHISEIMREGREKGFFVTYNHPSWSKEYYPQYSGYQGMHAFEIMNGACCQEGYDDYNPRVYDDFLYQGKRIYCIGADDNHNFFPGDHCRNDSGLAFTMIQAERLDYRRVTRALEKGNFYASQGPEIHALWLEEGKVHIRCSQAERIYYHTAARRGEVAYPEEAGGMLTEASFPVEMDHGWFRLEVRDEKGLHACTNAYFTDEVLKD